MADNKFIEAPVGSIDWNNKDTMVVSYFLNSNAAFLKFRLRFLPCLGIYNLVVAKYRKYELDYHMVIIM